MKGPLFSLIQFLLGHCWWTGKLIDFTYCSCILRLFLQGTAYIHTKKCKVFISLNIYFSAYFLRQYFKLLSRLISVPSPGFSQGPEVYWSKRNYTYYSLTKKENLLHLEHFYLHQGRTQLRN